MENISQKDASRFLEMLSVFSALAWESKSKDNAMERNVGFLMLLTTNSPCSLQVSPQSFVQCILCYYILITICFCICVSTFSSPFAFAFVFLHSHHHLPFAFMFFEFSSPSTFVFMFLHCLLLHLCFYIFINIYFL